MFSYCEAVTKLRKWPSFQTCPYQVKFKGKKKFTCFFYPCIVRASVFLFTFFYSNTTMTSSKVILRKTVNRLVVLACLARKMMNWCRPNSQRIPKQFEAVRKECQPDNTSINFAIDLLVDKYFSSENSAHTMLILVFFFYVSNWRLMYKYNSYSLKRFK